MAKLSKEDKLHIFEEWKLKGKGTTYLSKKYDINIAGISYLIALINKHDISILDKGYTSYTKEFKEEAIKRVLLNGEAAYAVSLDLGLPSKSMLINWIRSYKENGHNVIIKPKGRPTHEKFKKQRTREAEKRKRRTSSPEFKAYCRKRVYKKIECLSSKPFPSFLLVDNRNCDLDRSSDFIEMAILEKPKSRNQKYWRK